MMTSSNGNIFRVTVLCVENSPVTGEFPSKRPVVRSFDIFLICAWINDWVNNHGAGELRCHRARYDVTLMNMGDCAKDTVWTGVANCLCTLERGIFVFISQIAKQLHLLAHKPQGSVLGPLLLLLFINDVSNLTTDGCVLNMYASDVIIYTSAATSDDLQLKLQRCVDNIYQWYSRNKLTIKKRNLL